MVIKEAFHKYRHSSHNQLLLVGVWSLSCNVAHLKELPSIFFSHVMKQPVLQRVAHCCLPLSIKDVCCILKIGFMIIYCHLLNGNQLVELRE